MYACDCLCIASYSYCYRRNYCNKHQYQCSYKQKLNFAERISNVCKQRFSYYETHIMYTG